MGSYNSIEGHNRSSGPSAISPSNSNSAFRKFYVLSYWANPYENLNFLFQQPVLRVSQTQIELKLAISMVLDQLVKQFLA